jgi:uncharacterized protein (TIRG00374 family)
MRRWGPWLLKGGVSAALVILLLWRLDLGQLREAFAHPSWPLLGIALLVYGVSALGGGCQWTWILRAGGIRASLRLLQRLYLVGLFFNNFLPANVGGDAVKIFDLGRREGRPMKVFCATLLDRLLGLTALTLLALLATAAAVLRTTDLPPVYPLLVAMVIWLGLLVLLLSQRVAMHVAPLLRRLRLGGMADRLESVLAEFRLYRARVGWLVGVFLLALVIQTLRVATHLLAALALGVDLTGEQALQLFVLVPLLGILIALPISVNGIGLRESASALTFTFAGIAAHDAVAIELTAYLIQVAFSLVGGWFFWRRRTVLPPANRGFAAGQPLPEVSPPVADVGGGLSVRAPGGADG